MSSIISPDLDDTLWEVFGHSPSMQRQWPSFFDADETSPFSRNLNILAVVAQSAV